MIEDYRKQMELIEVEKFNKRINVIGCGALGSWLTFFLLKMGFKNIHVYDFDEIEEHNIPNQLFKENQIKKNKTSAIDEIYKEFFTEDEDRLKIHNIKITDENASSIPGITFCCVDSMTSRKNIYENCYKYGQAELWIEGRIGIFGGYIYTLNKKDSLLYEEYEKTLYADEEAEVSACGISQTALPAAVNVASDMLMQMISWYRGNDVWNSIQYQIPDFLCFKNRWGGEK